MLLRSFLGTLFLCVPALAQTVQPVITEYKGKADGKLEVTNNTLQPMVVVLEPESFSITPEGKGIFRPLDAGIHVELSTMSIRLQPKQSYYVFYKATADKLPAWFTIYATFAPVHHGDGLDVRIMLPHTIYLYQKQPMIRGDVSVKDIVYSPKTRKLICDLENTGDSLARVQEVQATGGRHSEEAAGFPFLPGAERRIEMDWKDEAPPTEMDFRFEHFALKLPVTVSDE